MKFIPIFAIAASLLSGAPAYAQTVDMEKLSCDELSRVYLGEFVVIDAWLSGFYHGKSNKTVVDTKQVAANTQKVVQFCKANPGTTVMQAIDKLISAGG